MKGGVGGEVMKYGQIGEGGKKKGRKVWQVKVDRQLHGDSTPCQAWQICFGLDTGNVKEYKLIKTLKEDKGGHNKERE